MAARNARILKNQAQADGVEWSRRYAIANAPRVPNGWELNAGVGMKKRVYDDYKLAIRWYAEVHLVAWTSWIRVAIVCVEVDSRLWFSLFESRSVRRKQPVSLCCSFKRSILILAIMAFAVHSQEAYLVEHVQRWLQLESMAALQLPPAQIPLEPRILTPT